MQSYPNLVGTGGLLYSPGIGNLTTFQLSTAPPEAPLFANLQGVGDLIPDGKFPQTLPPLSQWVLSNGSMHSDYIQYGTPTVTAYVDTLGPCGATTTPTSSDVISAGAYGAFSAIIPGGWVEIYGSNLAPETLSWSAAFTGNNAPTSLDGVQVTINGEKAFVSFISSGQVNVQVPSDVPAGGMVQVIVTNNGVAGKPYSVQVNPIEPGLLAPPLFKVGANQYVVALTPDALTYILPSGAIAGLTSRPAKPGETIVLYGVGFGAVTPDQPAGQIVRDQNQLTQRLQILFGQTPAQFKYQGLAPGAVGLYQFNVVVPSVPDSDLVPLTFNLGGVAGTQTLYVAVHQ